MARRPLRCSSSFINSACPLWFQVCVMLTKLQLNDLQQQNRALKRRNAELRERTRAGDEQLRERQGSSAWPLRFVEKWFSKRGRS